MARKHHYHIDNDAELELRVQDTLLRLTRLTATAGPAVVLSKAAIYLHYGEAEYRRMYGDLGSSVERFGL